MKCLNCSTREARRFFCSKSCSASYTLVHGRLSKQEKEALLIKNCPVCGNLFSTGRSTCSRRCSNRFTPRGPKKLTIEEEIQKFWFFVEKTEDCWIWTGSLQKSRKHGVLVTGYGRTTFKNKRELAHRVSWEIHNGDIPTGRFVCHHCDNPRCVRPDHLFLGTNLDNIRDMISKNRQSSGDKHRLAILNGLVRKLNR